MLSCLLAFLKIQWARRGWQRDGLPHACVAVSGGVVWVW